MEPLGRGHYGEKLRAAVSKLLNFCLTIKKTLYHMVLKICTCLLIYHEHPNVIIYYVYMKMYKYTL